MAQADSTHSTLLFPSRRRLLTLLGAGAIVPSLVTTGAAAPDVPATHNELLCRYSYWLHLERRFLSQAMWPDMGADADRWVPHDRIVGRHFHDQGLYDAPPGRDRAAAVLTAAGVSIAHDPLGYWS